MCHGWMLFFFFQLQKREVNDKEGVSVQGVTQLKGGLVIIRDKA